MCDDLKISVITAVYNRINTIEQALQSVKNQSWQLVEHIVIDGASTDGTLQALQASFHDRMVLVSETDKGIYYALNKGVNLASGDVIGVLHSDDYFADDHVLSKVAAAFDDPKVDVVFGDLDYVDKEDSSKVIRRWRSDKYKTGKLSCGWMPPHPTLYIRRSLFERMGAYNTNFSISSDYDLILRYFSGGKICSSYIPHVLIKMRLGGESNRSLGNIWLKTREDYAAIRSNKVGGVWTLVQKNFRKLKQFFNLAN
jgi:glycosyltransferase involved in cell wall biosynthesis